MWKQLVVGAVLAACDSGSKQASGGSAQPTERSFAGIDLVVVPKRIADISPDAMPTVIMSKTALIVDGRTLLPLTNGIVDPAEKEGGALGIKIPKLLSAVLAQPKQETGLIAFDRTTPYHVLVEIMFTLKSQPLVMKRFAIIARVMDTNALTALTVTLPDRRPASAASLDDDLLTGDGSKSVSQHHRPVADLRTQIADNEKSTLTPDIVLAKIQSVYLTGIRRCYKALLLKDAKARGKVNLTFTVNDTGRVTEHQATGITADCITPQMEAWRFPKPGVDSTNFSIALQLVPDDEPAQAEPPVAAPQPEVGRGAAIRPIKLIVSVAKSEVMLWSISGQEGSLQAPKLTVPLDAGAPAKIHDALVEIVKRRFDGKLPETEREIVFMGSGETQAATFLPLMAEMQSVFPDLLLSSGFE